MIGKAHEGIYPEIDRRIQIVPSTYGYTSGYQKSKSIPDQVAILRRLFPSLVRELLAIPITVPPAPDFTEGWFVVPHWSLVAQTYSQAVSIAISALERAHGGQIYQYCFGKLESANLKRNYSTERAMRAIHEGKGKVLTIPAQFGIRYRGVSSYRAKRMYIEHEFGLGLFEVIIMLITHPERLKNNNALWIECPGDSYAYTPEQGPVGTPFLNIIDGKIGIGTVSTIEPDARFGPATWFLL